MPVELRVTSKYRNSILCQNSGLLQFPSLPSPHLPKVWLGERAKLGTSRLAGL